MADQRRSRDTSYGVNDEYPDDLEYRDSEEGLFYPTSNETFRADIDQQRTSREVSVASDFHEGAREDANSREDYIQNLHRALDMQDEQIKDLNRQLKDLREECREYFSSLEEKLNCFEEKVDLVLNLVSSWTHHPSRDRRCRGFCTKHVRTDKCLCRGLKEPHRCCGHIGGICDC